MFECVCKKEQHREHDGISRVSCENKSKCVLFLPRFLCFNGIADNN